MEYSELLCIGILLFLVFIFWFYKFMSSKNKKKQEQKEKELQNEKDKTIENDKPKSEKESGFMIQELLSVDDSLKINDSITEYDFTPKVEDVSMLSSKSLEELKKKAVFIQNTSKGQRICKEVLEEIYKMPYEDNYRPDWLKHPITKKNLELDCYNDRYKIACEFQGIQHYIYPNHFHKTKEAFIHQVKCDKYKKKICELKGIHLIIVPYVIKGSKIVEYITQNLPECIDENCFVQKE